jgi:hypothetical protein
MSLQPRLASFHTADPLAVRKKSVTQEITWCPRAMLQAYFLSTFTQEAAVFFGRHGDRNPDGGRIPRKVSLDNIQIILKCYAMQPFQE